MITVSTIYIVCGLIMLIAGGYLLGAHSGYRAREALRRQLQQHAQSPWASADSGLQAAMEHVLAPLLQRERLTADLAQFNTDTEQRRDLAALLDKIAGLGGFSSVILSNEEGLPLAANQGARDLDAMAAIATRLLLVAEQVSGEQGTAPVAVLVRNGADSVTLSRIFQVHGQRISLTAVSSDARINSLALDPALVRIETMLSVSGDRGGNITQESQQFFSAEKNLKTFAN